MSVVSNDRTVHAGYEGMEIVRYDRGGKWYLEPTDAALPRQHVGVKQAARQAVYAIENGGDFTPRLPGGASFDRYVAAFAAAAPAA